MRTQIVFVACIILSASIVNAQKLVLPIINNAVVYEGTIKTNNIQSADVVCSKIKSWLLESAGNQTIRILNIKEDGCAIEIKVSNSLEPKGTFDDVECIYTINIFLNETGIYYNVNNIFFSKAQQTYDVFDVYRSYLKGEPYVKVPVESKKTALRRHEYIMGLLNDKMNNTIKALNDYLFKQNMAMN